MIKSMNSQAARLGMNHTQPSTHQLCDLGRVTLLTMVASFEKWG